jgi:beta-aspartyl-dipeptidase (metallo-type)
MSLTILRGGTTLLPTGWSLADIVMAPGGIVGVGEAPLALDEASSAVGGVSVVDCTGRLVVPGLVDGHLHLAGGGGGGGFHTRIPELPVDAVLEAGITTCVAMPGVDNVSRNLEGLLALAQGFSRRGVRALAMTGGFQWPPRAVTGTVRDDVYLLPALSGVKIALGEHLATAPDVAELTRLLRELHWVSRMTAGPALLHAHLGTSAAPGRVLSEALERAETDPAGVQVTHANYTPDALADAISLGRAGCWVDVNPLLHPGRVAGAIAPAEAVGALIEAGVPAGRITMSSDGNASVPRVLPDGTTERFSHQLGLLGAVHDIVRKGVLDSARAFALVTANPAAALRQDRLGAIACDAASDAVVLDPESHAVETVVSDAVVRVRGGVAVDPGLFRDPRWRS